MHDAGGAEVDGCEFHAGVGKIYAEGFGGWYLAAFDHPGDECDGGGAVFAPAPGDCPMGVDGAVGAEAFGGEPDAVVHGQARGVVE